MDVHLDGSKSAYAGRLDVIEGPTGRAATDECRESPSTRDNAVADLQLAQAAERGPPGS
jgi:hypothetical protein